MVSNQPHRIDLCQDQDAAAAVEDEAEEAEEVKKQAEEAEVEEREAEEAAEAKVAPSTRTPTATAATKFRRGR